MGDSSDYDEAGLGCSSFFCFPSCGWVLRSEELFLKTREAKFLLVRKSLILELKLLNTNTAVKILMK